MTADQYQSRLSVMTYKIYRRIKQKKAGSYVPYSVYYHIWLLFTEETRRATDINL